MTKKLLSLATITAIGCSGGTTPPTAQHQTPIVVVQAIPLEAPPLATNAIFTKVDGDLSPQVKVTRLELPAVKQGSAIWGATGRDHRGHLYFGVSSEGANPSAHLLEYKPKENAWNDLGGAVEMLNAGAGIGQAKIHTKIIQGPDGYLYFASMDEAGEQEDGTKLPTHGSHLWRLKVGTTKWEHLKAVPEGVLACAVGGRYIYYLGYFGHALFQFDTTKSIWATVKVGATGGHITRNFLTDRQGHVYVPRVKGGPTPDVRLVEYDEYLVEVTTTKLEDYSVSGDADTHGIVGVAIMVDGGCCFTTDQGRLYRIRPQTGGASITDMGTIHPQGRSYPAALVSIDGDRWLLALASMPGRKDFEYEAIAYDLVAKKGTAVPVVVPAAVGAKSLLVYGSTTRDDAGAFYVGGRYTLAGNPVMQVPCVWKVELAK